MAVHGPNLGLDEIFCGPRKAFVAQCEYLTFEFGLDLNTPIVQPAWIFLQHSPARIPVCKCSPQHCMILTPLPLEIGRAPTGLRLVWSGLLWGEPFNTSYLKLGKS